MRIGEMNRDNYASFLKMVSNMQPKGQKVYGANEDTSMFISKFEHRFTPTNIKFSPPNWNELLTKREPAMSDEEFEEEIRKIAREHATIPHGKHVDMTKYYELCRPYISVASPDRVAIYNQSMQQTGGKMNAAKGFFDSSGQLLLMYNSTAGAWSTPTTDAEMARARQFHAVYVDEIKKVKAEMQAGGIQNTNIDTKA